MKDNRESRSFYAAILGVRHQSAGTGSSVSKIDWSGQVKSSLSRSSAKQLRPQADQRVASLTTPGSVKLGSIAGSSQSQDATDCGFPPHRRRACGCRLLSLVCALFWLSRSWAFLAGQFPGELPFAAGCPSAAS